MQHMKYKLGIMAFTTISLFASCSDDDIVAKVTFPAELEQSQATGLENYSYTIPFEVKSDTEWKIEFDEVGEEIAYAHPASGKGNATIKLYIMDNLNNEARQGTMTVVFPEDNSKNKVVTLKQKAKDASDENFSTESVGNITYGVGYGFNVVTGIGPRAIKSQIIKAQLLTDENLVQKAATSSASVNIHTYTGSTVKELSNNFSNTSKINKIKGWGIEAEANSKFNMTHYNKEEYQYAMSFVDVSKEQISITLHEDEWAYWNDLDEGCYTKAAYKALSGENRKYTSDDAGFKKLFDTYGTHVIRTATLGGRLTIATTINTSNISNEYNLKAFAKLSYSGIVDVSNEVNEEYKKSFKQNSNACQTKISALGGSSSIFNDLSDLVGDGAKNAADNWFKSLNDDESTWTFIGLENKDFLIPIWELVEDAERAKRMQEYFESGRYAHDANKGTSYDMGAQACLENGVPEFDVNGSQIADVKIGSNNNKTVARICNEYIPELNEKAPVKVIYPVIDGKVKWKLGWFVGNSNFPPRLVVNTNGTIKTEMIDGETTLGEVQKIYIRGVRIGSTPVDENTPVNSANTVPYYESLVRDKKLADYKLVKILGNIWLAENYGATVKNDRKQPIALMEVKQTRYNTLVNSPIEGYDRFSYYNFKSVDYVPAGWHKADKAQIDAIVKMLELYNVDVADAFGYGGCLGFNAIPTGYLVLKASGDEYKNQDCFYLSFDTETTGAYGHLHKTFYISYKNKNYSTDHSVTNEVKSGYYESVAIVFSSEIFTPLATPMRLYRPIE